MIDRKIVLSSDYVGAFVLPTDLGDVIFVILYFITSLKPRIVFQICGPTLFVPTFNDFKHVIMIIARFKIAKARQSPY